MAEATSKVYVETTIPSYLTSRPSTDVTIASHQRLTHLWWNGSRQHYQLYVSELVVREIGAGHPEWARERLAQVQDLPRVATDEAVRELAADYARLLNLPARALADAIHLALTVVHEIDYLLTWNCRHLANPQIMRAVTVENTQRRLHVPLIVTPENLLDLEGNP